MYLITHRSRGGDWVPTAVAEVLQPCCSIRSRGRISMRSQTDVGGMSAVARLVDFCNVLPALLRLHCSVTALVCIGKTARRAHDVCFVVPVGLRTAVLLKRSLGSFVAHASRKTLQQANDSHESAVADSSTSGTNRCIGQL